MSTSTDPFPVYITPEIAHPVLTQLAKEHSGSFHSYTGGLGYLAGTYAMDAPRAGLSALVVAPLSRYYKQTIIETPEGRAMGVEDPPLHLDGLLELTSAEFSLPLNGTEVWVRVWRFVGAPHGSTDVLFLDTDYDKNSPGHRVITRYLYGGFSHFQGGDDWRRIAFAFVLGVGAVRAAELLGYPVNLYHLNECHAVFAAMELLRETVSRGVPLDYAIEHVRGQVLFTTHTPVPAGIWQAPIDLVVDMVDHHFRFGRSFYLEQGRKDNDFNLAVAAVRFAGIINAVSRRHRVTTERMFAWIENKRGEKYSFVSVTNGVSFPYWQHARFREVTTVAGFRQAKLACKRDLIDFIRLTTGKRLSEDAHTLTFARRCTGYKRPGISLEAMELLLRQNRAQLIFAGTPNPDEGEMVGLWNRILRESERLPNLVVLPGYDVEMSHLLKAGSDGWLFTSAANKEACATSPASAMLNGTIVIGTPDGMMQEVDPLNFFRFGHESEREWSRQYRDDMTALRSTLAAACELYYQDRDAWDEKALSAMSEAREKFTGERMLRDYRVLYEELLGYGRALSALGEGGAKLTREHEPKTHRRHAPELAIER